MEGVKFEKVSRFADTDIVMPVRSTELSAGYDFVVVEDIILKPYEFLANTLREYVMGERPKMDYWGFDPPYTLDDIATLNKQLKTKLPLVTTGMKCKLPKELYLELVIRSSTPLKHWIMLANGVGVIDADYYNNPNNEGEIYFQLLNLAPFAIQLKKGDVIGQGIIHHYEITEDDEAKGKRVGGFGSTSVSPEMTQFVQQEMKELTEKNSRPGGDSSV